MVGAYICETGFSEDMKKYASYRESQPYSRGDNAFYIIYLVHLDGRFRAAESREAGRLKLVAMYVFPEDILVEKGILSTSTHRWGNNG